MSDRSFSSRRRAGQRFRPGRGQTFKPERGAGEARAEALGEKPGEETVFDTRRHEREIQRAENQAAGLPPDAPELAVAPGAIEKRLGPPAAEAAPETPAAAPPATPATEPAPAAPPAGLMNTLKAAAQRVLQRVTKLVTNKTGPRKEIIINAESLETRVALLEEGRLEEFTIERTGEERLVGSIFKGKVRNLEEGLKAAFVDIGFEKNAFLHYWDIVPASFDSNVELVEREDRRRKERPKISQKDIPRLYPPGTDIVVQVSKGPIGTKGPRVTTNLALPGRFLVLLPNSDQCGVSRKIEDPAERQRLKQIVRKLTLPEGMGVIIRTAGEGQQARYFVRDLALLLEEWKAVQERINTQPAPCCVFREPDLIERSVRDFLTDDVERILVDHYPSYERIRDTIAKISRRSAARVKFYNESQPIFDRFGITRQLQTAFARQVPLKSGGYIVVDETEALVAIDVNTGRHKSGKDPESTLLKVNLEACEEICRQLRLRNMGGLIVLDFIDMKSGKDRQLVYQRMKELLKRDRARTHILPISPLGLMEMTRQRHTESVQESVYDDCPYCKGRGVVKSTLTMSVEIQRKLAEILRSRPRDESDFQLRVVVHPGVLERLRHEDQQLIIDLEKRYFGKLSFRGEPTFHAEQFKIYNALTNEELASVGG